MVEYYLMKKAILAVVLLALSVPLALGSADSGDIVSHGQTGTDIYSIQVRLIDLGYLNYRPTGKFSGMTTDAVRNFQRRNNLPADGRIGTETMNALFSEDAVRQGANPSFSSAVGRAYTGTVREKGVLSSWDNISRLFPVGAEAKIIDYNTGGTYVVRRTGGENNAEVTVEDSDDNDLFSYVFGGYSWEHRPVLVEIDGVRYAASMFGMPTRLTHGATGAMSGSTFLYFNNSRSDLYGISDAEHLVAISTVADAS